jgi:hypothetical protein
MSDVRQTVDAIFEGYLTNLEQLDPTVELLEAYFDSLSPEAHPEFFDLLWRRLSSEPVSHLTGRRTSHEVVIRAWASFGPTDSLPAHVFAILDWKDPKQMESWAIKIGSEFVHSLYSNRQRFAKTALDQIKSHLGLISSEKSPELIGVTLSAQLVEISKRINTAVDKINFESFQKAITHSKKRSPAANPQSTSKQTASDRTSGNYESREIVNSIERNAKSAMMQPLTATILKVLIASPSDVSSERDSVQSAIQEWNAGHHDRTGVMLHPVRWETHSYPSAGDRPQALINKQIVDSAHLLIGIFGYRLGTPTGEAQSGTIEEIERFRQTGRHVALYFSNAPVPRNADRNQFDALEKYRREREQDTLYATFDTPVDLRRLVTQHLPKIVSEICERLNVAASGSKTHIDFVKGIRSVLQTTDDLNHREIELLCTTAKDPTGQLLHSRTLDGEGLRANGKHFLQGADARTAAEWFGALRRLEDRGFIAPLSSDRAFFSVTDRGYQAADDLSDFARWAVDSIALRARYLNAPSEQHTLTCNGVVVIPARYFDSQVGADASVMRSLRERKSLLVEGVDHKSLGNWMPNEVEFVDTLSGKAQVFRVDGMQFLSPASLKLPIVD